MEAGPQVQDTFIGSDKPQVVPLDISVEADANGTSEIPVNIKVKSPPNRPVIPSVSDVLSVDGEGSVASMGGHTTPNDYRYQQGPGGRVPREYPTSTVPRNYQYGPPGSYNDFQSPSHSEAYASLNRGARMDDRYRPVHADGYRTLDPSFKAHNRNQLDPYAAQPQVGRIGSAMEMSTIPRFVPDPYGLEDDQRSVGFEDPDYGMGYPRQNHYVYARGTPHRTASYEGTLDRMSGVGDMLWGGGAPLALGERGSMASIDSIQKRGPGPGGWRQPELSEVIAMLNYRLDAVQLNAAAYLQHLTYQNDKVKSELRNLKGIPPIVALVDHPNKEVYFAACGALRNISFGKDPEIKSTIVNCDGAFCLVKLLRKTHDRSLIEIITGTLWNLSSNEALFKTLIERALTALTDEILVLHSGVKQRSAGAEEGKEKGTPPNPEWEKVLINTTGFLRNVSAAEIDERKKIRECKGLIDSVVHIIKSQTDSEKLTENCVCVLRNLSYHLHIEIPNHDHYKETASSMRGQRFSSRRSRRIRENERQAMTNTSAKGWELLCQPELIKEYGRLLDSKNPHVLEASAGAIQNLCAGDWTCGREVRAKVMEQKSYEKMVKHLDHENELVIQAMSGALCNLALDPLHTTELGLMAVPKLMSKLPDGEGPLVYSEQTRMAVLSALYVILGQSLEAAKTLLPKDSKKTKEDSKKTQEDPKKTQELYKLVQLKDPESKNSNRYSEREVRAASLVLQKLWDHKGLRSTLLKNKYKKTDFELTKKTPSNKKSKGSSEKEAPKEKGPEETTHLLNDSKDEPGDRNFEKGPTSNRDGQLDTAATGAQGNE